MNDEKYLIRATEIQSMPGIEKSHFLNDNAVRINKSLGDATGLTGIGVHIIEVKPGCDTTEFHVHHHEDECVFILSGTATAYIGTEEYVVGAGDFLGYKKGGQPHTIKNTGESTLRCLVVGERLAHDVGDYPNQKKRIYRNVNMPWDLVDHSEITEPKAGRKK